MKTIKKYLALALFGLIIFSCNQKSLDGEFVKVKENNRGGELNILKKGLVTKISFNGNHCNFEYFGIPMSGEYKIDKNFVYIKTGGELGTLSLEIIDKNTLEGEGWISGTFERKNK